MDWALARLKRKGTGTVRSEPQPTNLKAHHQHLICLPVWAYVDLSFPATLSRLRGPPHQMDGSFGGVGVGVRVVVGRG